MKRFISVVLSACIMLSLIGTGGFSFAVPAENPLHGTEYAAMFDSASDIYGEYLCRKPAVADRFGCQGRNGYAV